MRMKLCVQSLVIGALAVGLMLVPAPNMSETPVETGGSCLSVGLEGSVADADPLNPDDITGTLDAGALSCTGNPRSC